MNDRTVCCIPGCRRSTKDLYSEWICGKHWMRLTKIERRTWARIKRQARRRGWDAVWDRGERVWSALKRRAAE